MASISESQKSKRKFQESEENMISNLSSSRIGQMVSEDHTSSYTHTHHSSIREDMASSSKHHKSKQKFQESEEDRISNLPSGLIGHILSFLPTKYAVRTCVLSPKWKLNWTFITNIDIEFDYPGRRIVKPLDRMNFMKFVSRVLQQCSTAHMNKFRVRDSNKYNDMRDSDRYDDIIKFCFSHVNAWVTAALSRNFQEFDVKIPLEGSRFVSRDLLTCGNLVVLKLGNGFLLKVPDSVCLKSLKILHMCYVKFLDNGSLNRLFLGCPVLEELNMEGNVGENVGVVNISAPLLKRLIISDLCWGGGHDDWEVEDLNYNIVLYTPSLVYLDWRDYVTAGYSVQKLHHLVNARIAFELPEDAQIALEFPEDTDYFVSNYIEVVTVLLEGISKVQVLRISGSFFQAIGICGQLPKFLHVTFFEIGDTMRYGGWKTLSHLLDSLPHLETLVFAAGLVDLNSSDEDRYPPQNVPSCLLSHLKVIEILDYQWENVELESIKYFRNNSRVLKNVELEAMKYFLKNSRVLEKLTVKCDPLQKLKLTEELMRVPMGSSCCHVEVISHDI